MRQLNVVQRLGVTWGGRIRQRREALGISQRELAERCDVTQQTISRIEMGAVLPRDVLKIELARQLDCSPRNLFPWPATTSTTRRASRRART
jgi:transcriptional regulator with XRE-family HTH domain